MLDFLMISSRSTKRGVIEIYPKFIIKRSNDLMIRGGDFYAIWCEDLGLWSTNEDDVSRLIDNELDKFVEANRDKFEANVQVLYMWDSDTGMIDKWHRYCQKQMRDSYHMLDEKLIFSNTETNKKDYASKRLKYPLEPGSIEAFDKIMSTLYSEEERHKIEWAIGAIVTGDSKTIQKFMVLYGSAGTGKSTVINIIQQLFEGYWAVFDAKALGSASAQFALEPFRKNPMVAIQHDGDLSRIEDNTRLNSLVSHETMSVNEKHKTTYENDFKAFLIMGTNKPVKITDAKSGIIRRLIDVTPSGNKLNASEYRKFTRQVKFELGAIAYHCRDVYLDDPGRYDDYVPTAMMGATNDFYNFILDSYSVFKKEDGTTLKAAWEMYKTYCDDAKVTYPYSQRNFKEELKNYFYEFNERFNFDDGSRVRSYYSGFREDKFETKKRNIKEETKPTFIQFDSTESIFDKVCAECPAQYATVRETPRKAWAEVKTSLMSLDTSRLHFVKIPTEHIVIDFDIKDENGEKSFEKNVEAASKWPATYAELSKSGKGVHLHYIYTGGDPTRLSSVYDDDIEIKVYSGNGSLRRKLTKCNNLPIANISSGLPLKGDDKVLNWDGVKNEKVLRAMIKRNINKEYHPSTASSISYINKLLNDAYASGMGYDVSDMFNGVLAFAAGSTNQADNCIRIVNQMKFKSEEPSAPEVNDESKLVFYDVEVFPNLFLVNWKYQGTGNPVVRMINPSPKDIEGLLRFRLVGFNNRRYDNHMLYARLMGYTNEQLFNLSQKIINEGTGLFSEAYGLSYTDIYDFAAKKQSLKKWEIELGLHHHELGLPWDKPVPEELWVSVAEYCDDDVLATEAVFDHLKGDFLARQILADLAGMTVNDTTNTLTTRIIFGKERNPKLVYTNLATGEQIYDGSAKFEKPKVINSFPGYEFVFDETDKKYHNMYRGTDVGLGGYVYADPYVYGNVALLDIQSMHPASLIAMNCFGEFTQNFKDIRDARVAIKSGNFEEARSMLGGKLAPYLDDESKAADLAQALKIAINSVYGLTSATFQNPMRDIRNKNNIVALRGALFMRTLQDEVTNRGFTVAHIKTDSIKIANATPEIIQFCMEFAEQYGYIFEHEATYDRMCLVNDAVYIARYATADKCQDLYGYVPKENKKHNYEWTATGTQFAVPYVFKTLFSGEPIEFDDMCETKSVKTALYLDVNENLPDVTQWENLKDLRVKYANDQKITLKDKKFVEDNIDISEEELDSLIATGHDYKFIGKVGRFCPIKPGCNGALLMTERDGKYYAATGSGYGTGKARINYRWLESEMVKEIGKENDIDRSYYDRLVDDASMAIGQYCELDWFISDKEYDRDDNEIYPF